jgi:hypothetical protein
MYLSLDALKSTNPFIKIQIYSDAFTLLCWILSLTLYANIPGSNITWFMMTLILILEVLRILIDVTLIRVLWRKIELMMKPLTKGEITENKFPQTPSQLAENQCLSSPLATQPKAVYFSLKDAMHMIYTRITVFIFFELMIIFSCLTWSQASRETNATILSPVIVCDTVNVVIVPPILGMILMKWFKKQQKISSSFYIDLTTIPIQNQNNINEKNELETTEELIKVTTPPQETDHDKKEKKKVNKKVQFREQDDSTPKENSNTHKDTLDTIIPETNGDKETDVEENEKDNEKESLLN